MAKIAMVRFRAPNGTLVWDRPDSNVAGNVRIEPEQKKKLKVVSKEYADENANSVQEHVVSGKTAKVDPNTGLLIPRTVYTKKDK